MALLQIEDHEGDVSGTIWHSFLTPTAAFADEPYQILQYFGKKREAVFDIVELNILVLDELKPFLRKELSFMAPPFRFGSSVLQGRT